MIGKIIRIVLNHKLIAMRSKHIILALCCLFLFSCEVDSVENEQELNSNVTIENTGLAKKKGGQDPAPNCDAVDMAFENRLTWTAYIAGLALYQNSSIITELQVELDLNATTKALKLNDLLGSNTSTPVFKAEFERFASDIMNEVVLTTQIGGGCPDIPAGGPDDPNGGDVCGNCDQYQIFMSDILVNNCIELYFPRGVHSNFTVDITTVAHPLCNAYGNYGYERVSCGSTLDVEAVVPNYVQIHDNTYIVARPYIDGSNGNCDYSEYSSIELTDYLYGSWPLAN